MMTFNELQQVGSACKGETRSVQGPSLVALQKELPMVPNWMSSCELAMRTRCFLSLRYDVNQSMTFPLRLYDFLNRCGSVLWLTLS